MATFDYSGVIATAKSLINKFGKSMVRITSVAGGEEWNPTIVETSTNITGVMTAFKSNQIDGTLILASDKQILTYYEVVVGDKVDGFNVVDVDIIAPANDKILYKVQVRK